MSDITDDEVLELTQALECRRILEIIKAVAATCAANDAPSAFESGFQMACEEIFYRATHEQWHMDEDETRFQRPRLVKPAPGADEGGTHG